MRSAVARARARVRREHRARRERRALQEEVRVAAFAERERAPGAGGKVLFVHPADAGARERGVVGEGERRRGDRCGEGAVERGERVGGGWRPEGRRCRRCARGCRGGCRGGS